MKQQNPWRTTELATLRDAFERNPNISPDEVCALIRMHTRESIDAKRAELGIERVGVPPCRPGAQARYRPGWRAIADLLETGAKSRQQLADALGCSRANVQQTLATMPGHWHIAGYTPSGHHSVMVPMIGLGAGKDATYPKKSTQSRERLANPFSVCAGLVKPIDVAIVQARVVRHLHDEPEEITA